MKMLFIAKSVKSVGSLSASLQESAIIDDLLYCCEVSACVCVCVCCFYTFRHGLECIMRV